MGKKTEEELNQILENVKQITQASARIAQQAQESAAVTQASVRITGGAGDGEGAHTEAYQFTPSQENVDNIMEAVNRLVPPDDLQKMTEAAERMKSGSGDMADILQGLFTIAQASGSTKANPAATQELLALQEVLTQKKQKPRDIGAADERAERAGSVWRTVYIVLGVVIIAGLILTLAVPGFGEAVKGLFR